MTSRDVACCPGMTATGKGWCTYYEYNAVKCWNGFFSAFSVNAVFALLAVNCLFSLMSINCVMSLLSVVRSTNPHQDVLGYSLG